jgi:hypothetical protein
MPQITEWLGSLGLDQYAQVFDENGIDFNVGPASQRSQMWFDV